MAGSSKNEPSIYEKFVHSFDSEPRHDNAEEVRTALYKKKREAKRKYMAL